MVGVLVDEREEILLKQISGSILVQSFWKA